MALKALQTLVTKRSHPEWLNEFRVCEEIEQEDNELPEQIDYVLQEGAEGEKIVREKLTQTWNNGRGT